MEKNLTYLNSKWWYRLVKVLFLFLFVAAQVLGAIGLFVMNSSEWQVEKITKDSLVNIGKGIKNYKIGDLYDVSNPMPEIDCIDKSTKTGVDCAKEFLDSNKYAEYVDERKTYIESQLKNISDNDYYIIGSTAYYDDYNDIRNSPAEKIAEMRVAWLKNDFEKYEYQNKYSDFQQIIFHLILFIVVSIIFVSIQRGFYYIVLGSIRPKK